MPRPREFDTEELLGKVLLIFLENGWQQTSMRLLESSTGVKQVSLYNAFGNKEALFLAAFDQWAQQAEEAQNRFMKCKGVDGIAQFVKAIVRKDSPFQKPQCGCLAVNTAVVTQAAGPAIQARVKCYRDAMHERILGELLHTRKQQGLKPGLRLASSAELVLNAIWGIFVTIRLSGTDPSVGKPGADALVRTMQGWIA